jgi:hypothetical protein
MNYIFIGYDYNNNVYWFLVYMPISEDFHSTTIIKSKNDTFFKDMFSFKET